MKDKLYCFAIFTAQFLIASPALYCYLLICFGVGFPNTGVPVFGNIFSESPCKTTSRRKYFFLDIYSILLSPIIACRHCHTWSRPITRADCSAPSARGISINWLLILPYPTRVMALPGYRLFVFTLYGMRGMAKSSQIDSLHCLGDRTAVYDRLMGPYGQLHYGQLSSLPNCVTSLTNDRFQHYIDDQF